MQKITVNYTPRFIALMTLLLLFLFATTAFAHGVSESDKVFIEQISGMQLIAYIYLGAKHMVTGYDHLLLSLIHI